MDVAAVCGDAANSEKNLWKQCPHRHKIASLILQLLLHSMKKKILSLPSTQKELIKKQNKNKNKMKNMKGAGRVGFIEFI